MLPWFVSRTVVVLAGVCYPAYGTFKAIRAKRLGDCLKWMMYWSMFTPVFWAEPLVESLFGWLPFYYDLVPALVMWLALPSARGAVRLYRYYLQPALCVNELNIDRYTMRASELVTQIAASGCVWLVKLMDEIERRARAAERAAGGGNGDNMAPPPPPPSPRPKPEPHNNEYAPMAKRRAL